MFNRKPRSRADHAAQVWRCGRVIAIGMLMLLTGCAHDRASLPVTQNMATPSPLPAVLSMPGWPADTRQIRTTAADSFLSNLDADIDAARRQYAAGADNTRAAHRLATFLTYRYQIRGQLTDAQEAESVLLSAIATHADDLALRVAHARWLGQFHQFNQAHAILSLPALANHADARAARMEMNLALGRYAELGDDFHFPGRQPPADFYALAAHAAAAVELGDLKLASTLYFEAQSHYREAAPYPLAWLHTQQGIALLRFGHFAAAQKFFATAQARLPGYVLATEHLAECLTELGQFEDARALYHEVIDSTGNPEYIAALADLEARAGNEREASTLKALASSRYEQWLAVYPQAYWQHAAEHYLEIGEIDKARELADKNLELRQDVGSRLLRASVAKAEQDQPRFDTEMLAIAATGLRPPEYQRML